MSGKGCSCELKLCKTLFPTAMAPIIRLLQLDDASRPDEVEEGKESNQAAGA
jgi:hypothetical protein